MRVVEVSNQCDSHWIGDDHVGTEDVNAHSTTTYSQTIFPAPCASFVRQVPLADSLSGPNHRRWSIPQREHFGTKEYYTGRAFTKHRHFAPLALRFCHR